MVVHDGLAEKLVALLWAVAFECRAVALFIDCGVHRLAHGGGQGFGHIADPATNNTGGFVGVRLSVGFYAPCDFGEKVARLQFQDIRID